MRRLRRVACVNQRAARPMQLSAATHRDDEASRCAAARGAARRRQRARAEGDGVQAGGVRAKARGAIVKDSACACEGRQHARDDRNNAAAAQRACLGAWGAPPRRRNSGRRPSQRCGATQRRKERVRLSWTRGVARREEWAGQVAALRRCASF